MSWAYPHVQYERDHFFLQSDIVSWVENYFGRIGPLYVVTTQTNNQDWSHLQKELSSLCHVIAPDEFLQLPQLHGHVLILDFYGNQELQSCVDFVCGLQTQDKFDGRMLVVTSKHHRLGKRKQFKKFQRKCEMPKGHGAEVLTPTSPSLTGSAKAGKSPIAHIVYELRPRVQTLQASKFSNKVLAMAFDGLIAGMPSTILLDSGASDNFLSSTMVSKLGLVVKGEPAQLTLGNGSKVQLHGKVLVHVKMQAYQDKIPCFVTDLAPGTHMVLGETWLNARSALLDYEHQTCTLKKGNKRITLVHMEQTKTKNAPILLSSLQVARSIRQGCSLFHVQVENCENNWEDGDKLNESLEPTQLKVSPSIASP